MCRARLVWFPPDGSAGYFVQFHRGQFVRRFFLLLDNGGAQFFRLLYRVHDFSLSEVRFLRLHSIWRSVERKTGIVENLFVRSIPIRWVLAMKTITYALLRA